jgi:hypothetical protein
MFRFNEKKTTQVAALFIKKHGGTLNYTKLIKLLYLADRESLRQWNRPITGDDYVSMGKGPVLSKTYDLINYEPDPKFPPFWHTCIKKEAYDVSLLADPGHNELNKAESDIIEEIYLQFKDNDWRDMIRICHDICPEWRDPGRSTLPISIRSIFRIFQRSEEEIKAIEADVDDIQYVQTILPPAD